MKRRISLINKKMEVLAKVERLKVEAVDQEAKVKPEQEDLEVVSDAGAICRM